MTTTRSVKAVIKSKPTIEGAGVHLNRAIGFQQENAFDPFLLLDDFRSTNPDEFLAGFPWHPHRGIETITYILEGMVEHKDSMGNQGAIGPGDVQWMTAGNGIVHQEMPQGDEKGHMGGFQLWANLPASHKMMNPRYQEVKSSQIPVVTLTNGVKIRIICGNVNGTIGPVQGIITDPEYLDISMPAGTTFTHATKPGHTVFAYTIEGNVQLNSEDPSTQQLAANGDLIQFNDGDLVVIQTGSEPCRFLLISGNPIREPVAWYGPIVMNTQEEIQLAIKELREGTFIKSHTK